MNGAQKRMGSLCERMQTDPRLPPHDAPLRIDRCARLTTRLQAAQHPGPTPRRGLVSELGGSACRSGCAGHMNLRRR